MIEHPILGTIDPSSSGFWSGTLPLAARQVPVRLRLREGGVSEKILEDVLASLEDLPELDLAGRAALARDAAAGDETPAMLYVDHHVEELADEELDSLVGTHDRERIEPAALLAQLMLVEVLLYPEQRERQLVLEYSLEEGLTDYSLSVAFDASGEPCAVDVDF